MIQSTGETEIAVGTVKGKGIHLTGDGGRLSEGDSTENGLWRTLKISTGRPRKPSIPAKATAWAEAWRLERGNLRRTVNN